MASVKADDYEKVKLLGGGGQGEVWQLRRKSDGKMFAGKFVKRGVVPDDKIVGEAAMLYKFDHPGLVKGYGIGLPASPDEPVLILMELMDGPLDVAKLDGTLKSILLMTVAKALAFLHSKGVVHLDLKPANILLRALRAKIGDFGSAKLFGLSVTQTSMALTQSYASPDALNGEDPDQIPLESTCDKQCPHVTEGRKWIPGVTVPCINSGPLEKSLPGTLGKLGREWMVTGSRQSSVPTVPDWDCVQRRSQLLAHAVEKWAFLTNLRNLDIVSSYGIARLFCA
jgi:serine/threonine protein kinase